MNHEQQQRFYNIADNYQTKAREFGYSFSYHHTLSGENKCCEELENYKISFYLIERNEFTFSIGLINSFKHEILVTKFGEPKITMPLRPSSDEIDLMLNLSDDFFDQFVKNHDDKMILNLQQQRLDKMAALKRELAALEG